MMTYDKALTSKVDVPEMHDESHNPPNVPHLVICEVQHLHGPPDDGKVFGIPHVSPIVVSDDVTGHRLAL